MNVPCPTMCDLYQEKCVLVVRKYLLSGNSFLTIAFASSRARSLFFANSISNRCLTLLYLPLVDLGRGLCSFFALTLVFDVSTEALVAASALDLAVAFFCFTLSLELVGLALDRADFGIYHMTSYVNPFQVCCQSV